MESKLDVSWQTIFKIFVSGFALYVLFLARDVIVWLFFAFIISILVTPVINFLRWLKFPKIISVVVVYLAIFGILGFVVYLTAPIFIFELRQFSQNIPGYFEKINPVLKSVGLEAMQSFDDFTKELVVRLEDSSAGIFRAIVVFFGGITSTFVIFTLAFFISLEKNGPEQIVALFTPKRYEQKIKIIFETAQEKVAGWFGARILACFFVGVATFIALYFLKIKYALILAILGGVLNFVPYVGPIVATVLTAFFAGVSSSWIFAIYVFAALLIIQTVEGNILSPYLMKKFMDLPPALVLVSLIIGGQIFGFLGTIFAVPVFGIIYEFLKEFLEKRREENYQLSE